MEKITGKDLIDWGFKPGPWFSELLSYANKPGRTTDLMEGLAWRYKEATKDRSIPLKTSSFFKVNLDKGTTKYEKANYKAVVETMKVATLTPTVVKASVMPDACPSGPVGTIPVGGVISAKNAIHPGMHSSNICCSLYLTEIKDEIDVATILNAVQKRSHFGPGGRAIKIPMNNKIIARARNNKFLNDTTIIQAMYDYLGTQGDGNHFFFVGRSKSTGRITLVTHHGSRKPGALLYKKGMKAAEEFRIKYSSNTLKQNAWIPYETEEGKNYWEALQIIRAWTKLNHFVVHSEVLHELNNPSITDRFWNEHNFVFKDGDIFHHAKGATPTFNKWAEDRRIIPLNMGEPILIVTHHIDNTYGFAPHGAGRNISRTQSKKDNISKTYEELVPKDIDCRFYTGTADISELPGAYKSAKEVCKQIKDYKLAHIVDEIEPLGSMRAGEIYKPWLQKHKK